MSAPSKYALICFFLATSFFCYSQDDEKETIFIISDVEKPQREDKDIADYEREKFTFFQHSFSFPLTVNPEYGEVESYEEEDEDTWFIPDGVSAHTGYGIHLEKWIGIAANTGIDWRVKQELVSVPIYASLFLNPHFDNETSVFLQVGLGQAFAIGRGRLNGTYQKYRLGILFNDVCVFAEANGFGYPLHDVPQMGSFSIGISLINF